VRWQIDEEATQRRIGHVEQDQIVTEDRRDLKLIAAPDLSTLPPQDRALGRYPANDDRRDVGSGAESRP
jgi:hypothetical protein